MPSRHQLINGLLDDGFSSAGISGRKSELGGLVQFLNMQSKANNQNERVSVLIVVHGFLLAHKASESPYISSGLLPKAKRHAVIWPFLRGDEELQV